MMLTLTNKPLTDYFPDDLIRYITPFTYKLYPTNLLKDIKTFHTTKEIITSIYFKKYNYLFEYEKDADLNWLNNDILTYSKRNKLPNYKNMNNLYIKSFLINPKKKNKNEYLTVQKLFNLLWSKLSPHDRQNFIETITKMKMN